MSGFIQHLLSSTCIILFNISFLHQKFLISVVGLNLRPFDLRQVGMESLSSLVYGIFILSYKKNSGKSTCIKPCKYH